MAQRFFHGEQDGFFVWRAGVKQSVGCYAGAGQAWGEQVARRGDPEGRAFHACQDACREQGSGRAMDLVGFTAGHFMKGATHQASFRQMGIDVRYAEWQNPARATGSPLQQTDALAQLVQAGFRGQGWQGTHVPILFPYAGRVKLLLTPWRILLHQ